MSEKKIRALRADEVEVRVANLSAKGAQFLIYKDARVDKRILDETFGVFGWRNRYEVVNGNLYCTIDIKNPDTGEWVSKCDCGTESNTEKEKGEASDAFKRACFNVGIGRELYTKIFIFIPGITEPVKKPDGTPVTDARGKPQYKLTDPFMKFSVSEMEVDEEKEKITKLVIADEDGIVAFRYPREKAKPSAPAAKILPVPQAEVPKPAPTSKEEAPAPTVETLTKVQADVLLASFEAHHGKCEKGSAAMDKLKTFIAGFGVKKIAEIPATSYDDALRRIKDI